MIRPKSSSSSLSGGISSSAVKKNRPPIVELRRRRKQSKPKIKIPFLLIVIIMILAMSAMGVLSIYSMLYLTDTMDKQPPNRHIPQHHDILKSTNNNNNDDNGKSKKISIPNTILLQSSNNNNNNNNEDNNNENIKIIQNIKTEFYERYGGIDIANEMLKRGIKSFGSIQYTANRMINAALISKPFIMAFSGYSITVGRGNFFNQSFPFVIERILKEPIESLLGTNLIVRNGAIGGIPSFPYGFCLNHFLGGHTYDDIVDVIGWDYSMNEKSQDGSVLEAFIRQATQQLHSQYNTISDNNNINNNNNNGPMVIILDHNSIRTNLLNEYTKSGLLNDAIAVGKSEVINKELFHTNPLPKGLLNWDEFGAPKQCPGRGSWHPKYKEHELIGWMISMHFIQAIEIAYKQLLLLKHNNDNNNNKLRGDNTNNNDVVDFFPSFKVRQQNYDIKKSNPIFPKPIARNPVVNQNDNEINELLYGHHHNEEEQNNNNNYYYMKDLSCRTSFLPATDHTKVIPSVIVSGLIDDDINNDIMKDRTDTLYHKGWVLDVSKVERDTKRKVERCGGLGYIDMKIALYGIPESGPLRLWLPFEKGSSNNKLLHENHKDHDHSIIDNDANHWYDDLIICEANEKRSNDACQLDQDLDITVGGIPITKQITKLYGAGEYLKRTTCVNIGIPKNSKITKLSKVTTYNGQSISLETKQKLLGGSSSTTVVEEDDDDPIGLIVDIHAKAPKVTRSNGACCISHIVWEQH